MTKYSAIFGNFKWVVSIGIILGIWWLSTSLNWINPLFLPSLDDLGNAIRELLTNKTIYLDAFATAYRALIGLVLSAIVAIPLGLVLGRMQGVYEYIEFPVDFFRSIPSSALFFLFILVFGVGDLSKIAVVFYGCSLIILVATIYGAKVNKEKQDRINMLTAFRATPFQVFHLAVVRDALPHITAGLRISVSLSLVLGIVTEMFLGATNGLGRQIYDFYLRYEVPKMYAVIIILGLLGFAFNKLFFILERKLSFWQPAEK